MKLYSIRVTTPQMDVFAFDLPSVHVLAECLEEAVVLASEWREEVAEALHKAGCAEAAESLAVRTIEYNGEIVRGKLALPKALESTLRSYVTVAKDVMSRIAE